MSKLSTQPYRGTRDLYPTDYALQRYIFETWRTVCQLFGYEEYLTPTIEPIELYTSKTSEEIVQEQTYSFTDRGDRNVTIRPEMTPSVSRLVASKQQAFGYPLRLFSIANFMRYERPQKGRLREFWQLNADIFGMDSIEADIEIIQLADVLMKTFGANADHYEIRVNSRKLLMQKVEAAIATVSVADVMRLIDKKNKLSPSDFATELEKHVADSESLLEYLSTDDVADHPELKSLFEQCTDRAIDITFDPTVTRGFDYYTDIVFEVFDTHPDNNRSMFGGGRYDNLIDNFSSEPVASAGFGMGDATLTEFLQLHDLAPPYQPSTDVMVASVSADHSAAIVTIASDLRARGLNVATDTLVRKPDKKIKTATKLGINHIMFIGDEEADSRAYTVKNIHSGEEFSGDLETVARTLTNT